MSIWLVSTTLRLKCSYKAKLFFFIIYLLLVMDSWNCIPKYRNTQRLRISCWQIWLEKTHYFNLCPLCCPCCFAAFTLLFLLATLKLSFIKQLGVRTWHWHCQYWWMLHFRHIVHSDSQASWICSHLIWVDSFELSWSQSHAPLSLTCNVVLYVKRSGTYGAMWYTAGELSQHEVVCLLAPVKVRASAKVAYITW